MLTSLIVHQHKNQHSGCTYCVQAALPLKEGEDSHAMCALWQTPTPSWRQPCPDQPQLPALDTYLVNAKLLNLWNFECHRSHATHDRKRTAYISTSNIECVSHHIHHLLSVCMCRLLIVCLRRLSISSESHLTVA